MPGVHCWLRPYPYARIAAPDSMPTTTVHNANHIRNPRFEIMNVPFVNPFRCGDHRTDDHNLRSTTPNQT